MFYLGRRIPWRGWPNTIIRVVARLVFRLQAISESNSVRPGFSKKTSEDQQIKPIPWVGADLMTTPSWPRTTARLPWTRRTQGQRGNGLNRHRDWHRRCRRARTWSGVCQLSCFRV